MRDVVILAIILGSAPICLFHPYFGTLMWSWIAYFNPHRYGWGIAYSFPVAEVIAFPTLIGSLFTRKNTAALLTREALLLIGLWVWFAVTTIHTLYVPEFAAHAVDTRIYFEGVSKILLMALLTILLVTSPKRLKYLLVVTALSLGLRAVAGALFGLRTGGTLRVYGPPRSFIADNNAFALALDMTIPMLFYLARMETSRWGRYVLRGTFVCAIVSVLLTYSRGGLLGLVAVMTVLTLKSGKKLLATLIVTMCTLTIITIAPQRWMDRMSQLAHGNLDESARERLISWGFAWKFANVYPIMGGGFQVFPDDALYQHYQPEPLPGGQLSSGPHSIYFQMLGEQGFVGLGLFLLLLGCSWARLRTLRRRARGDVSAAWVVCYSHMLETSLLAYMISGAFLGLAYFDLFYQVITCVVLVNVLYRQERASEAPAETSTLSSVGMELVYR